MQVLPNIVRLPLSLLPMCTHGPVWGLLPACQVCCNLTGPTLLFQVSGRALQTQDVPSWHVWPSIIVKGAEKRN